MLMSSVAKQAGLLRGLSWRALASDPVRSVTTSAVAQYAGKDVIDEAIPNDPNDAILTSLRGALFQIRECTRALRQMDIPWDTTNTKAVEKFAKDFEAIRLKAGGAPMDQQVEAEIEFLKKISGGDVRKWVTSIFGDIQESLTPELRADYALYLRTIDEIEGKTGKKLDNNNAEGMKLWNAAKEGWKKQRGITQDVVQSEVVNLYKGWIEEMREELKAKYKKAYEVLGITGPVKFEEEHKAYVAAQRAGGKK